jgi:hypothetical protein
MSNGMIQVAAVDGYECQSDIRLSTHLLNARDRLITASLNSSAISKLGSEFLPDLERQTRQRVRSP